MPTFHATGIVLRVSPTREDDRRASIYTKEHGKIEVFARSARRLQSKLSPHLEPLTLVDCFVARGRADHLAGIERQDRFTGVRQSLEQLTAAMWATELVDALTRPDHADPRIFRLLQIWITMVEAIGDERMPEQLRLAFVVTLFNYLGHGPQCTHCVKCKKGADHEWLFTARDGGIVCRACRSRAAPGGLIITSAMQRALHLMTTQDLPTFDTDHFEALPTITTRLILDRLIAEHLDRPLATNIFLSSIDFSNKM